MFVKINLKDEICLICLESLNNREIFIGTCGHVYCLECRSKLQVCPECREIYQVDIKKDLLPILYEEIEDFFCDLPYHINEVKLTAIAVYKFSVSYFMNDEMDIKEMEKILKGNDFIEFWKFEHLYNEHGESYTPEEFFFNLIADIFFGYLRTNFPDLKLTNELFQIYPIGLDFYDLPIEQTYFYNCFENLNKI